MSPSPYQIRRATLEDLAGLRKLWEQAQFSVTDLEKHLTEFQVAAAADGSLAGCLGLQIAHQQGRIRAEAYRDWSLRAELRPGLWERVQSVARNHGLIRLWIQEADGDWPARGFREATAEQLKELPAGFGGPQARWLMLQLREGVAPAVSVEHEFELFKQAQREMSEKAFRQVRVLRFLAGFVAAGALGLALWAAWYVLRHLPTLQKP